MTTPNNQKLKIRELHSEISGKTFYKVSYKSETGDLLVGKGHSPQEAFEAISTAFEILKNQTKTLPSQSLSLSEDNNSVLVNQTLTLC